MTDVLLAAADGAPAHDFTAKLPFDWPGTDCLLQQVGIQFARGYGLSYKRSRHFGRLPEPGRVGACSADSR